MAKAASLLTPVADILPAKRLALINPLVYCNMNLLADDRFRRLLLWYNAARDHDQAPVWLGQYGPDTLLSGDSPFPVVSGGEIVDEQAPPGAFDPAALRADMLRRGGEAFRIGRPCLLACSQGEWTWGHWLLDMLPKIVLAEHVAPQRFMFAVPGAITQPGLNPRYVGAVMESLAAYGIECGRLLPVQPGGVYWFDSLFDISGIRGKDLHPGAIGVMQRRVNVPVAPRRKLTALMRDSAQGRSAVNSGDIGTLLTRAGAARVDPSRASFAEQVQAFRDSDTLVGDLGSNLAAVIFARPQTGLVTLAPAGWHDFFFIPMFQRQCLYHADVRGVSVPRESGAIAHAPYLVDPRHVEDGLHCLLGRQDGALASAAGRLIARAPGPPVWALRFGAQGNAAPCQTHGFDAPEPDWTWSLGASCALEIPPFARPAGDFWLDISGTGYTAMPALVSRMFSVVVNDVLRADFDIDDLTRLHVAVPDDVLSGRDGMKLVFHHPVCPSPRAMGDGQDGRALGFRFDHVALRARV